MKRFLPLIALALPLAFAISCVLVVDGKDSHEHEADYELCTGCGEVYGSSACCDAEAARCDSCDMIKGSPGCCK